MAILTPILTGGNGTPTYNLGIAETYSWIPIENNQNRPMFARANYITNLSDLVVSLTASDLNIGNIHISDAIDNAIEVTVQTVGVDNNNNNINAMVVKTQDLDSNIDDITIGDKSGVNFASITNSALNVFLKNGISAVSITNFPTQLTAVSITNQLTGITVLNPVSSFSLTNQITSVSVTNFPTQLTAVSVTNFPIQLTAVSVTNQLTGITVLNPISSFSLTNQITSLSITNFPTQLTAVSVTNQLTSTSVTILNPVSSFTLLNSSIEISNDVGNPVPVNVTNTILTTPNPTQIDAFGRLRVSTPLTLFDSSHRYRDNNLWSSLTAVNGSYAFNQNQGLMDLTVSDLSGSSVIRETTKVFAYQPGKSLLVMNTFVMASSATNLRQRVGYFGSQNGIYFQLDDGNIGLVERSLVSGSVVDTVVLRSSWNGDKLDGTGASGLTLDITKAQIFWMDIEWLGLGSVRAGFIINGQYIVCHTFHHANIIASTYITTASLPLRYEITNKAATGVTKTLKQICSTVISEGGYELRGLQQAVSIPISGARTFAAANTYYPIISIKLRTDRLDAIVILTALSILGDGDKKNYNWQVIASGTTTGGQWLSAGSDSAVQYNITGTSFAGGRILASGYVSSNNSSSPNVDILKEALFKFQLERNYFTSTPYELTLAAAVNDTGGTGMWASMDWEEISR